MIIDDSFDYKNKTVILGFIKLKKSRKAAYLFKKIPHLIEYDYEETDSDFSYFTMEKNSYKIKELLKLNFTNISKKKYDENHKKSKEYIKILIFKISSTA